MIEYINGQLNQWGLWCRSGRERLGYPARSAFMRLVPSDGRSAADICDDDAMQINRAVQSLPGDLRKIVDLFYIKMRSCPAQVIAKAVGIHRDTFYVRMHKAHVLVMDAIHDEELLTPSDTLCKKRSSCG